MNKYSILLNIVLYYEGKEDNMAKNEFVCDCNIIHEDVVKDTLNKMKDEDLLNKLSDFF